MNSRYFLTADSPCNIGNSVAVSSILQTIEERTARAPPPPINPRGRPSRNSSSATPILIKLAMKMSRARWYSFLRRVFHYQNGSGSDLGPNPFNSGRWMLLEFVCLVVQISVTVYTLIVSRGENPVWPMRIWVSGYVFGCFISLVLLHWRYRVVFTFLGDPHPNSSDVEQQQQSSEESRNLQKFRTCVELLFAIWFVMGNIWVFDSRFGSYNGSPKLHVLCVSLLAWNAVSYSFPFILFVLLCCCVPFLSGLLGYNINTASRDRGATDEQIAGLSCWKYEEDHDVELGDHEYRPECCICLARYREKEEMRELPCNHIFHLRCVDQWLKILSCCPLCKQQINKSNV
ncbi:E3 ubiquitin-protein ligase At4g11680-like [Henckelia pumila]|uniref:E3 ubiquitin-protein ligase At4g11680-like n=1 Tax=Henckelia pumila TaxID=405737 RepID=UPI003C6E9AD6